MPAGSAFWAKRALRAVGSREGLQLSAVDPAVFPIGGFDAVPVRSHNQDYDFGTGLQRLHVGRTVERSGLQLATRSSYDPLRPVAQVGEMLVHSLNRCLGGGESGGFIGLTIAFECLSGQLLLALLV